MSIVIYSPIFTKWCNLVCYHIWKVGSKVLEHRQFGWKVLISKYDLGKSLSKEMWCKMADTKMCSLHILKDEKMHVLWGKSFLCPFHTLFKTAKGKSASNEQICHLRVLMYYGQSSI